MDASVIVLSYNYSEVIRRLLDTIPTTIGVSYELVVVDNGSLPGPVEQLRQYNEAGVIDTLVEEPVNRWFSEGNNIGVHASDSRSQYILLLNSDCEIIDPLWLRKAVEWMEGVPWCLPYTWSDKAERPHPGPRDIVSIGWSYDRQIPGYARPEGWCLLIRRDIWVDISPDFPFYYGLEEMLAGRIREGARCGVLCQYAKYIRHYEGGTEAGKRRHEIINKRKPDQAAWFAGLPPSDTLDFALGDYEHRSYIEW